MKRAYGKFRLKKLRVKKRSKKVQSFIPEKIRKALVKTGCESRIAEQTTRDVVNKILHTSQTPVVTFKTVAKEVIKELKKKDKTIARNFEKCMKEKNKNERFINKEDKTNNN